MMNLRCYLYRMPECSKEPNNPYKNLATEEVLVQHLADHVQEDIAILYLWQNADCVVFGRNQNPSNECRLDLMKELGVYPVRRKTGGGAVFHDVANLNFSFIVPQRYYDRAVSMQIIAQALEACGIGASVNGRNDIVVGNCKVSGNAYLSKDGVCLHHGTLLIATDIEKMERLLTVDAQKFTGKGIRSVRSRVKNLNEIMPSLTVKDYEDAIKSSFLECYAESSSAEWIPLSLDAKEMKRVEQLQEEYASTEWIFGHETGQIWQQSGHFDWGNCLVQCTGESYRIYSDTLYTEAFEQVKKIFARQDAERICKNAAYAKDISEMTDARQKKIFDDICSLIGRQIPK